MEHAVEVEGAVVLLGRFPALAGVALTAPHYKDFHRNVNPEILFSTLPGPRGATALLYHKGGTGGFSQRPPPTDHP